MKIQMADCFMAVYSEFRFNVRTLTWTRSPYWSQKNYRKQIWKEAVGNPQDNPTSHAFNAWTSRRWYTALGLGDWGAASGKKEQVIKSVNKLRLSSIDNWIYLDRSFDKLISNRNQTTAFMKYVIADFTKGLRLLDPCLVACITEYIFRTCKLYVRVENFRRQQAGKYKQQ